MRGQGVHVERTPFQESIRTVGSLVDRRTRCLAGCSAGRGRGFISGHCHCNSPWWHPQRLGAGHDRLLRHLERVGPDRHPSIGNRRARRHRGPGLAGPTATSTQFTAGSNTLPTNSASIISGPADVCDSGATCTLATNSVAYPYYLPAGSGPPTASKIFSAASSSGLADQTVTPTFTLTIPANTVQASYTSTWTISVVSGP